MTESTIVHLIVGGEGGGYLFSKPEGLVNLGWMMADSYSEVIEAKRKFLSLDNEQIERRGIPSEEFGNQYARSLWKYFAIHNWPSDLLIKPGYFLHDRGNHPLQALMAVESGICVPLVTSFRLPAAPRGLKQALLWHDNQTMSIIEIEGIKKILSEADVRITEMHAGKHSVAEFAKAFESDTFDFIHVSSHGRFDYEQPHRSEIVLGPDLTVSLSELRKMKRSWDGRRLLFLNICDGATTSLQNSPASIGFSPILVHPGQSMFSHLWPVNQRVAMIYAWVVCEWLTNDMSPEEVYTQTISTISGGRNGVVELLRDRLPRHLLDHIDNLEIDLTNFTHHGSLVYMI